MGVSYVWVLEFQRRGAPHFHILWTNLPDDWLRMRAAVVWGQIVSRETIKEKHKIIKVHNHKRAWEPLREEDGAKRYMAKYCLKTNQKEVPDGFTDVGRFWGASQDVKDNIKAGTYIDITDDEMRDYLAGKGRSIASWDILPAIVFDY